MSLQVKEEKSDRASGFYCDVCDCTLKDSLNYLDHVRGKRHNRNIGISLKNFTDSTLDEVRQMLEFKKRERDGLVQGDEEGFEKSDREKNEELLEDDDDEDDEYEIYRKLKRDKKKRQKSRRSGRNDEDEDHDGDTFEPGGKDSDHEGDVMAKLMGFSSFASTKD